MSKWSCRSPFRTTNFIDSLRSAKSSKKASISETRQLTTLARTCKAQRCSRGLGLEERELPGRRQDQAIQDFGVDFVVDQIANELFFDQILLSVQTCGDIGQELQNAVSVEKVSHLELVADQSRQGSILAVSGSVYARVSVEAECARVVREDLVEEQTQVVEEQRAQLDRASLHDQREQFGVQ